MHRSAALSWARHREVELENQAAPGRKQHGPISLAALIRWYIETFETISKWQLSKQSHLEFLERAKRAQRCVSSARRATVCGGRRLRKSRSWALLRRA